MKNGSRQYLLFLIINFIALAAIFILIFQDYYFKKMEITPYIILDASALIILMMSILFLFSSNLKKNKSMLKTAGQFQLLANNIDSSIWIINEEFTKLIYMSPGYEKITGYSLDEIYQDVTKLFLFTIKSERDKIKKALLNLTINNPKLDIEYQFIRKDGVVRWIHLRGTVHYDEAYASNVILGIATDITERKMNELSLKLFSEISATLNKTEDINLAIQAICNSFLNYFGFDFCTFWHADEVNNLHSSACWYKNNPRLQLLEDATKNSHLPPEKIVPTSVYKDFKPLVIPKITTLDSYKRLSEVSHIGLQSAAYLPVTVTDKLIGILEFFTFEQLRNTSHVDNIFKLISEQITIFIKRQQLIEESKNEKKQYQDLVELSPYGIVIESERKIVYANKIFTELIKMDAKEILGKPLLAFVHPDDKERVLTRRHILYDEQKNVPKIEEKIICSDGSILIVEAAGSPCVYQGKRSAQYVINNITHFHQEKLEKEYVASHDKLTALHNQLYIMNIVEKLIVTQISFSIMLLDVAKLNTINNSFGSEIGNLVLKMATDRLKKIIIAEYEIARSNQDEFILILPKLTSFIKIKQLTKKIIESFETPFQIGEQTLIISLNIGVSIYPDHGSNSNILFRNADLALNEAKINNEFVIFNQELATNVHLKVALEQKLRRAISKKEFFLVYQPQIALHTKQLCGFEALLRWQPGGGVIVSPDGFIHILEETGLIHAVSAWVMRQAMEQLKLWQELGLPPFSVSINLSASQFHEENFLTSIKDLLEEYKIPPQLITIEITESEIITNPTKIIKLLNELKQIGIRISLDDFGTGYSTLNILKTLPINEVKIEQGFISKHILTSDDKQMIHAIITMAHNLKMTVVAEGVENSEQFNLLKEADCDIIQGYYLSHPLTVNECNSFLKNHFYWNF